MLDTLTQRDEPPTALLSTLNHPEAGIARVSGGLIAIVDHMPQHVGISRHVPLGLSAGVSSIVIVVGKNPRGEVQLFDDVQPSL